ncbi:13773_t:CDS:2, partial [Racocetra persica]
YWITDRTVSCILNSYSNLRCLGIWGSRGKIKDATIIGSSLNLKYFDISGNDIGDEVVEAVASTCHELEYLDLGGCGFITEPS